MGLLKNEQLNSTATLANLAVNILQLMEKNGVSDSHLARSLGLPYNTIKRITSGETTDPKISTLTLIADFFDVGIDKLLGNAVHAERQASYKKPLVVPVLSWKDLEKPIDFATISHTSCNEWQPVALNNSQQLSANSYALKSRKSMEPRFPTGTIFIIDPDEKADDGDIVLVKLLKSGEVTLRELEIDPPTWQLHSINSSLPPIQLKSGESEIMGVSILTLFSSRN